jgi:hypothetical protein
MVTFLDDWTLLSPFVTESVYDVIDDSSFVTDGMDLLKDTTEAKENQQAQQSCVDEIFLATEIYPAILKRNNQECSKNDDLPQDVMVVLDERSMMSKDSLTLVQRMVLLLLAMLDPALSVQSSLSCKFSVVSRLRYLGSVEDSHHQTPENVSSETISQEGLERIIDIVQSRKGSDSKRTIWFIMKDASSQNHTTFEESRSRLDCLLAQRLQDSTTMGADIGEWVEVGSAMDLSSIHIVEVGAQEEGCGFGHFTGGSCHRVTCEEEAVAALGKMLAHRQISMASVEQLETYQLHLKIMDKQIDYARRKELAKTIAPPKEIQYIAQIMRMTTTENQEDVSVLSSKGSIGTAWTEDITTDGSVSTFSSSGDDSDDDSVSTYHDFGTDDVSDSFNGIAEEFDDCEPPCYTVPWFGYNGPGVSYGPISVQLTH